MASLTQKKRKVTFEDAYVEAYIRFLTELADKNKRKKADD